LTKLSSKPSKNAIKLINAHFFYVDIVGLSDPTMSTKTQIKKIEVLNQCISETDVFRSTPKDIILFLSSGDGMCLGFLQGPELPFHIALELQEKLSQYNKGKIPSETIHVRIGLNSGNCFVVTDIRGNDNPWGSGIIFARRVMDLGDEEHILLTPRLAEDLRELSDEYRRIIKPVHDFTIKHGITFLLYSAYGDGFGNPKHPTKGEVQRSKYGEEIIKLQKTTTYPSLNVELTVINPETMLVQHKRTYEVANVSDYPIYQVLHGIATDVEKYSLNDLKVQVYDEDQRELKISSISLNQLTSKEFTTQFNKPIIKGEQGRKYSLVYEVEEPDRYFENAFLIDVGKFSLSLKYTQNGLKCKPVFYLINQETEKKTKLKQKPIISRIGNKNVIKFYREENFKGETIRLEW
jgi:hypothetical protein